DGAAALLLLQLAKILEEMGKAFLLRPAGEGVVIEGGGTVTGEDALEVVSQDLERDLVRAAAVDGVEGRLGAGEDPEPGALAGDAPARVVAAHRARFAEADGDLGVGGLGALGQAGIRLRERRGRDVEPEGGVEELRALPERDAEPVLQVRRERLGARAHDHARRPGGERHLLGVPRADPPPAGPTVAALEQVAPPARAHLGQVHLVLLVHLHVFQRACPAERARDEPDGERLQGLRVPRLLPVGEAPSARPAPGALGVLRLAVPRERRRLAPAPAQLGPKIRVLLRQARVRLLQANEALTNLHELGFQPTTVGAESVRRGGGLGDPVAVHGARNQPQTSRHRSRSGSQLSHSLNAKHVRCAWYGYTDAKV